MDIGNRFRPQVLICPACKEGPNNELHLVFDCSALTPLRNHMEHILEEATDHKRFLPSDNRKLCSFLGQDLAPKKTLEKRGIFLSILLEKFKELTGAV